jgi:hypothetical protein
MPVRTTRTLNPLPLGDLEPHRFEDLVRQLAYGMKNWRTLEAVGRGGSDDGIDIRALEVIHSSSDEPEENEERNDEHQERLWIFQCKREKTFSPKNVKDAVGQSLRSLIKPPYGFILAIACDVSKKARDTFREEMVSREIEEFSIWAKGELEDLLFQPRNDSLLFAYFGISLQARRKTLSASIRSEITKKKQLNAFLNSAGHQDSLFLLRDPTDERYPRRPQKGEVKARWLVCKIEHIKSPHDAAFFVEEYIAAVAADRTKWDAILDHDVAKVMFENELKSKDAWSWSQENECGRHPGYDFASENIPEHFRANLKTYRFLPYEKIIAIDPVGDGYYPIPHIFVEFDSKFGPFSREINQLEPIRNYAKHIDIVPSEKNRVKIFPDIFPGAFDPVPEEFDQTIDTSCTLDVLNEKNLNELLANVKENREFQARRRSAESDVVSKDDRTKPFRDWREKTALPILSLFANRLRKEGHTGFVQSSGTSLDFSESTESIELKVKLNIGGSRHNPNYHPFGNIKFSMSPYSGLGITIYPSESKPQSAYSRPSPPPKLEDLTIAYLESQIIALLQRMHTESLS